MSLRRCISGKAGHWSPQVYYRRTGATIEVSLFSCAGQRYGFLLFVFLARLLNAVITFFFFAFSCLLVGDRRGRLPLRRLARTLVVVDVDG